MGFIGSIRENITLLHAVSTIQVIKQYISLIMLSNAFYVLKLTAISLIIKKNYFSTELF